jgi:hypothetical protein
VSNIAQGLPQMRHAMDCAWSRRCRNAAFTKVACSLGWALSPAALRTVVSATISLLTPAAWTSGQAGPPGLYDINTETLMPHLEDNLRYANTRERRCVRSDGPVATAHNRSAESKPADYRHPGFVTGASAGQSRIRPRAV